MRTISVMHQNVHTSVLYEEVLHFLSPQKEERVLDCTLGLGGHSSGFCSKIGPTGTLVALDADSDNIQMAEERLRKAGFCTVEIYHRNFSHIHELSLEPFDIIFADLGLSSPHLDDPARGFSFRFDGPLDLRFDRTQGSTASELLAASSEERLKEIFQHYGELYKEARKLAVVCKADSFQTTTDLKSAVEKAFGFRAKNIMPQVFQALRIAVNDELSALETLLQCAPALLKPGGRFGVISFHSLEDRMVKTFFRNLTTLEKDPVTGQTVGECSFELPFRKPIIPSEKEVRENPRARSAKFRALKKKMV